MNPPRRCPRKLTVSHSVGYREQIDIKCVPAQALEGQCQVAHLGCERNLERESQDVQWPEIKVFETLPQQLGRDLFPVVHIGLGRVLSNDPVDDDSLFPAFENIISGQTEHPEGKARGRTHLSSNQPFRPRSQPAVWHGPAGIKPYASRPTQSVKIPCALQVSSDVYSVRET